MKTLIDLIDNKLPVELQAYQTAQFPSFVPHVTLISRIDQNIIHDPQNWVDSLLLPETSDLRIIFSKLSRGDKWTKKLFIRIETTSPLAALAVSCKTGADGSDIKQGQAWVKSQWDPHVSLVYSGIDISDILLSKLKGNISDAGIVLASETLTKQPSGWVGGSLWLVPTYLEVSKWVPIATKQLS